MNIFEQTIRPNDELFFNRGDDNDVRLGEIVPQTTYEEADVVILGYPNDEGVLRNHGRIGASLAPDEIRRQFYRLTPFSISTKIFDLGNTMNQATLEETHDLQTEIVAQILADGKKIIALGGGNDLSYADGCAMAKNYGQDWLALNVDAHFDVRADSPRNSGTPYRQLLDENLLKPEYFYEVGFQSHLASPVYYNYLKNLGVNLVSFEQLRAKETVDVDIRELMKQKFIHHSTSLNIFVGFDLDAVRSSDAPGTSAPSPVGLRAGEFITLVKLAASLVNTKIVEFTEVNPNFDIDNRTTKLVAIAMHRFCSNLA